MVRSSGPRSASTMQNSRGAEGLGLLGGREHLVGVEERRGQDRGLELRRLAAEVAVLGAAAGLGRQDALDLDLGPAPRQAHLVGQRGERRDRRVGQRRPARPARRAVSWRRSSSSAVAAAASASRSARVVMATGSAATVRAGAVSSAMVMGGDVSGGLERPRPTPGPASEAGPGRLLGLDGVEDVDAPGAPGRDEGRDDADDDAEEEHQAHLRRPATRTTSSGSSAKSGRRDAPGDEEPERDAHQRAEQRHDHRPRCGSSSGAGAAIMPTDAEQADLVAPLGDRQDQRVDDAEEGDHHGHHQQGVDRRDDAR